MKNSTKEMHSDISYIGYKSTLLTDEVAQPDDSFGNSRTKHDVWSEDKENDKCLQSFNVHYNK